MLRTWTIRILWGAILSSKVVYWVTLVVMTKSVTRLYEQFQPTKYGLAINIDRQAMTFNGTVVIRGKKVGRPTGRLTFHQKGLKITSATVTRHDKKGDQSYEIGRINNQDSFDEVRLHSEAQFMPGDYTIAMEFTGVISRPMNGIYPCLFEHDGQQKKLIATQFESHHAREAFPCIDEPEAKATFDLTVITPAGETTLGNTPMKEQRKDAGIQITTFETTPVMSVYLLAFVTGDMAYAESKTKNGTVVRSYATPDNAELLEYSVHAGIGILEFFEDYFDIAYPLPKLDMVALPDFAVGAMENWGLMTFREQCLLVDKVSTGIETKQLVALVVAHEISHQWFGDLVTMKWWDDLWLNESFANMMEYLAVDALHPEWNIWEQFVSHEGVSARRRDSLADVQPVHTGVNHPDEISTIFDTSIVYAKGGTLLHMLMHYIGQDAFRAGLKAYFEKHKYGNTVAADLWNALGDSSGQNIGNFMHDWLERPGYPLVTIDWQPGTETLKLTQQRFLTDMKAEIKDTKPWQVPLATTQPLDKSLFDGVGDSLTYAGDAYDPLLFNHDGRSYFLPYYAQPSHLEQVENGIKAGKVDTIDRILLLDNYNLLQRGGVTSTTDLLDLIAAYEGETSENVWGALAMSIAEARKLIEGDETAEEQLNSLIRKLVAPLVEKLGWDDGPADDAQTLRLRSLIISLAAGSKTPAVIDEGLRRFAAFKKPSDLPASTRSVVFYVGARYGSDADFTKLFEMHGKIINADEKEEIAGGLTGAKDQSRYKQLIGLLNGEEIRRQDLMHWFAWLLRNRYSRIDTWDWLKTNWDWVKAEFSSEKTFGYFARFCGGVFSHEAELKDFQEFFTPKLSIIAMAREITLAEQEIISRVAWRERNEAAVKTWLAKS